MSSIPVDIPISSKNYGFVIDNRKCIGCHACSVACKSENEVPLSVNRTWVKYVETGAFPNSRRHFQVTRCNHCENPPCVTICPTQAMYQRDDGIVEFDSRQCIGCKGCLQACPYDAIHIDPNSGTAAKCHFCAHRTEVGLEPACVVVCPEQAIIAGDMNDPTSHISHLIATQDMSVRKPEQGTKPNVFYIDGNDVALNPLATERTPETFMWADSVPLHDNHKETHKHKNGAMHRPIQIGDGRMAEQMVQVAYNAQHKVPWHWPVPAYLVTKGIGAGLFMILALGTGLNLFEYDPIVGAVVGFLSLLFIGITTGLLVYDLERPERFLKILLRPQWKSWLTRGAVLLIGFTVIAGLWWLIEMGGIFNFWNVGDGVRSLFLWVGLPFAVGSAVYTAFLFGQAEGRDLWQSPLLPWHLVVQALMMGGATWLIVALFMGMSDRMVEVAAVTFIASLIIDILITLVGEFVIPHATDVAAKASHEMTHGRYKTHFWLSLIVGHLLPIVLIVLGNVWLGAIAGLCAIIGLYLYEFAFVMAPQEIPNS